MIALGCDIEEIKRFENKSSAFLNRVFTKSELDYCAKFKNPASHLCARFCAKEAVIKAFGLIGISLYLSDIEILNKPTGAPYAIVKKYPDKQISISMSHCKNYAISNAVVM